MVTHYYHLLDFIWEVLDKFGNNYMIANIFSLYDTLQYYCDCVKKLFLELKILHSNNET